MKISIITVCYNSEAFITSAIDSVLSQSYPDIEYIVIDGASKDGTISIIHSYGDRIAKVVSEPDKGIYDAMNKGLALANGEVIGILNSDDFYPHDSVIEEVVKAFEVNPNVDMVLGNVDFVKSENVSKPVRLYSSFNFEPWKLRFGFMPAHPGAFIKRTAYERVGNYKLGYKIGADFEWFVRAVLIHRLSFVKLNKTLVRMREGGVSTSGLKSNWVATQDMYRALAVNSKNSYGLVVMRLPVKLFFKVFHKE
jgi:glycosyltransferase involved in cell wall biosynthesis